MLKQAKRASLRVSKQLGVFNAIQSSAWRRQRLLILCYHGVSIGNEHEWDRGLCMDPRDFEARLSILRDSGAHVLPLGEAVDRLYRGTLPPRSVAITFDDGAYNYFQAHRLLKKYGLPATVYLTTYYCDRNMPVFNTACAYLAWQAPAQVLEPGALPGIAVPLDLRTPEGRAGAADAVRTLGNSRGLSGQAKHEVLQQFAAALGIDFAQFEASRVVGLLTPEEVTQLAREGVDFQLHTHRHRVPRDRALFQKEIEENRRRIIDLTGKRPAHFCYPSGEYAPEFLPWLSQLGVASATTCDRGMASPDAHPMLLPRLVDNSDLSPLEFESWVAGVGAFIPGRPAVRHRTLPLQPRPSGRAVPGRAA